MQTNRIIVRLIKTRLNPVRFLLSAALLFALGCSTKTPAPTTRDSATTLREKLQDLNENASRSPIPPKTVSFSEEEVNLFLTDYMKEKAPHAIGEPQITIHDNAQITARVLVDVDEFKRNRKRNSGPLNFFSGKIPVIMRGDLLGRDGQGQFKLRSAEVNGLSMPRSLALELLANHTRTREYPNGFDIEKPFDLPLKIRELSVRDGELWVVQ